MSFPTIVPAWYRTAATGDVQPACAGDRMGSWSRYSLCVALAVCGVACGGSTFENVRLNSQVDLTPSSLRVAEPLAITALESVKDDLTLTKHNGQVVICLANFRSEALRALESALRPQFADLVVGGTPGHGLELVVLDVSPSRQNDALTFHVVLRDEGRDVYEFKDAVTPPPRIVGASAFSWKGVAKDMTVQNLEWDISAMAERVRDRLLINNELREFWRGRGQRQVSEPIRSL